MHLAFHIHVLTDCDSQTDNSIGSGVSLGLYGLLHNLKCRCLERAKLKSASFQRGTSRNRLTLLET